MKEISNSMLAWLVVGAIVISVFGSIMSLNRLNQLGAAGLTGFATSVTGQANLSVSSEAAIEINADNIIQLGTLATNITNTSEDTNDYWVVHNEGGVNISVELSDSSDTQTGGGNERYRGRGPFTAPATADQGCMMTSGPPYSCFLVRCNNSQSGTCNTTYHALYNDSAGSNVPILTEFRYATNFDEASFAVNVTVPNEEPAGEKTQVVTFFAACNQTVGC